MVIEAAKYAVTAWGESAWLEKILLFFCIKKVAIAPFSGIITTNLGKTATPIKIAGREKTDTSLQNMPFSRTGEGHFFWPGFFVRKPLILLINQSIRFTTHASGGVRVRPGVAIGSQAPASDGIYRLAGAKCT